MNGEGNNLVAEILIWVGLAFAAGFIGYFGRHLATIIIEKARRKKAASPAPPAETPSPAVHPQERPADGSVHKLAKKQAKAAAKQAKKATKE